MSKKKRVPDLAPAPSGSSIAYEVWLKEARKRRERALAMREAGKSVQEIADVLGVSKQRTSELIKAARRDAAVQQT